MTATAKPMATRGNFVGANRTRAAWGMILLSTLALSGCAGMTSDHEAEQALYAEASELIEAGRHEAARDRLERLTGADSDNPFARQARIDLAYLAYIAGDLETAREEATRFIERYPDASQAAYARYLAGLAAFRQWERSAREQAGAREPELAREAFAEFRGLVEQYPDSQYVDTGIEHMLTLRDGLARHELELARDKLEAGDYDEAIARTSYIAEQYRDSDVVPDALALQVEAHEALDNGEAAEETMRVLKLHFPEWGEREHDS